LRSLGIPIVTVDAGGHSDEVGYRIDNDAYALPPVDLTPAELGVVALAAQLWSDKTLRTDISRAMTKLRAAGAGEAAADAVAGITPRVRAAGDAYGPLLQAISERRAVSFRYRAANTGQVLARNVEPWRIAARGGGWYLVGFDQARQAPRVFRLSRIVGRVRTAGGPRAFAIPDDVDVDAMLGARAGEVRTAVLSVTPERAQAVRARGKVRVHGDAGDTPGGRDVLEVPFRSLSPMADELAGYADAVVVLEPADLRREVLRRLRAAATLDTDMPGGPEGGAEAERTHAAGEGEHA
jgi:proteasome accessory factor B